MSMSKHFKRSNCWKMRRKNVTNADDIRTIADRIRVMSDEELAKFLCCTRWRLSEQKECLEWLQQEADEINI